MLAASESTSRRAALDAERHSVKLLENNTCTDYRAAWESNLVPVACSSRVYQSPGTLSSTL